MAYRITNQNLVIPMGGGTTPGTGHIRRWPIWVDEKGTEYLHRNSNIYEILSDLSFENATRETVTRG